MSDRERTLDPPITPDRKFPISHSKNTQLHKNIYSSKILRRVIPDIHNKLRVKKIPPVVYYIVSFLTQPRPP